MENIVDLNNWLIVFAAFGKMFSSFWPVFAIIGVFGFVEWRANREAR